MAEARIIAKHDLSVTRRNVVPMSITGKVVHVDRQAGGIDQLQMWVEDEEFPQSVAADRGVDREYYIVGTGAWFPAHWKHVATVVLREAGLVWHVYEDPDPDKTKEA